MASHQTKGKAATVRLVAVLLGGVSPEIGLGKAGCGADRVRSTGMARSLLMKPALTSVDRETPDNLGEGSGKGSVYELMRANNPQGKNDDGTGSRNCQPLLQISMLLFSQQFSYSL